MNIFQENEPNDLKFCKHLAFIYMIISLQFKGFSIMSFTLAYNIM